jgi:murein DD-endopeptidase MepM/ murein hydrolase activator NlpD
LTPTSTPEPETDPGLPQTHIIQEGETLFSIAAAYSTTVEALQVLNNITDPALIFAGQEIVIPGAVGAPGGAAVFATHLVQVGDTLPGLASAFNTTVAEIAATNRLVHPGRIVAGQTLAILSRTGSSAPRPVTGQSYAVQPGDTLLIVAARFGLPPAEIATANNLVYPAVLFPGQTLLIPGSEPFQPLPAPWHTIQSRPGPWQQGDTFDLYVETAGENPPLGQLGDQELRFAPAGSGYVALAGIDAFTPPGLYPLELQAGPDLPGSSTFHQNIVIQAASYPTQSIELGPEYAALLAPEVRAEEDAFLAGIFAQFTPQQRWTGRFQQPVSTTLVTAGYGGARSYNGGPFDIYHTGIDYGGTIGTPILAAADGVVVYSDFLQLRGNTVIIDHGLGVMTGYYHLSQSIVNAGDTVTAGQMIGAGGSTGLSTGPHLHWDLRIHNVPVNGQQWLVELFPLVAALP